MNIVIAGAGGLIGSALIKSLLSESHRITRLSRPGGSTAAGSIMWDPTQGVLEPEALEGFDALINLAGENIGASRWTDEKKQLIYDSRIKTTTLLANRLKSLSKPPKIALFASAFGIYGSRGDDELTEASTPGKGFMADLCRDWEAAAKVLDGTGIRRVHLRIGLVLAEDSPLVQKMIPPFKMGLGGKLGSGKQWLNWISLDDILGVVHFCLTNDSMSGPVNVVSPQPVTNEELTKTIGIVLHRPTKFAVPAAALRLMFGEVADEALLASIRAVPIKLQDAGYVFKHNDLEETLRGIL